jgi:hypothetical protein
LKNNGFSALKPNQKFFKQGFLFLIDAKKKQYQAFGA